jgi:hypothetical protein
MDRSADQLVVRQHQRLACRLRVDVAVAPDSPCRVTLSRSAGNGTGVVTATVVDCSTGGMGIESSVYLPRQARLSLRVDLGGEGGTSLDIEATVQRATMISRAPKYYLGVAFKGRNAPGEAVIEQLLTCAAGQAPARGDSA